jgi:hypothetical protein
MRRIRDQPIIVIPISMKQFLTDHDLPKICSPSSLPELA